VRKFKRPFALIQQSTAYYEEFRDIGVIVGDPAVCPDTADSLVLPGISRYRGLLWGTPPFTLLQQTASYYEEFRDIEVILGDPAVCTDTADSGVLRGISRYRGYSGGPRRLPCYSRQRRIKRNFEI
jgi:hypothetical protein